MLKKKKVIISAFVSGLTLFNMLPIQVLADEPSEINNVYKEVKYESRDKCYMANQLKLKTTTKINTEINTEKVIEVPIETEFILTFYTSLDCENGYGAITCEGDSLQQGGVASNVYDLGTKIYLEGYGETIVNDRGGSNFNSSNRLDVFIEREYGESDYEYKQRVSKMGIVTVKGYIAK